MPLKSGSYRTRNSRIVVLSEAFQRTRKASDGSEIPVTGFRGALMKADGRTADTDHEWEDTQLPGTLGTLVRAGLTEGVANEFDLVQRIE
jgi:hypothetical protein